MQVGGADGGENEAGGTGCVSQTTAQIAAPTAAAATSADAAPIFLLPQPFSSLLFFSVPSSPANLYSHSLASAANGSSAHLVSPSKLVPADLIRQSNAMLDSLEREIRARRPPEGGRARSCSPRCRRKKRCIEEADAHRAATSLEQLERGAPDMRNKALLKVISSNSNNNIINSLAPAPRAPLPPSLPPPCPCPLLLPPLPATTPPSSSSHTRSLHDLTHVFVSILLREMRAPISRQIEPAPGQHPHVSSEKEPATGTNTP